MGNFHAASKDSTIKEDVNNNIPNLMKRTYQRISVKRGKVPTTPQASKQALKDKKRIVLRTMPRCSSFEDFSTLLPSSKRMDNDPTYLHWKRSFECPREKPAAVRRTHLRHMKKRVHDMTSAVSGHLTPRGFPMYTDLNVVSKKASIQNNFNKTGQYEKGSLQLSLVDDNKISVIQPLTQHKVLLQLPLSAEWCRAFKSVSKASQHKQAVIIEKLFRDIKNLESYYNVHSDSFVF